MSYTIPITNEPKQSFNFDLEGNNIDITLEYLVTCKRWQMTILYNDAEIINGMLLGADTLQLHGYNLPFDIVIEDLQSLGFSPFNESNFADGYYSFNIVDNLDLQELRGYEVQLWKEKIEDIE